MSESAFELAKKYSDEDGFSLARAAESVRSASYNLEDREEVSRLAADIVSHDLNLSMEEVFARRQTLDILCRAAKQLRDHVDDYISGKLGPAGYVRYGDYFLSSRPRTKMLCTDHEGLAEYLGEHWVEVFDVNRPRKTALRRISELHGDSVDTAEETYYLEEVTGPPKLAVTPVTNLKWTQKLEHGVPGGGAILDARGETENEDQDQGSPVPDATGRDA